MCVEIPVAFIPDEELSTSPAFWSGGRTPTSVMSDRFLPLLLGSRRMSIWQLPTGAYYSQLARGFLLPSSRRGLWMAARAAWRGPGNKEQQQRAPVL